MSCTPLPPPAVPSTHVTHEQYNAVLARLDAEILARTQLEADLAAAREQAAYLQRRLASLGHPDPRPPVAPADAYPQPAPSVVCKTDDAPASAAPLAQHPLDKDEPRLQPRDPAKTQDREILSHCSDISGVRSPDSNSLNKTSHRKSSTNLAAMNGVTKKSKSKKERAAKVKIPGQSRYWTPEEHKLFLEALNKYGHKDLRSISAYVGTRNMTQVRTHSQKYFMRLMREAKRQNPAVKAAEEAAPPAADASKDNGASSSSSLKPPSGPSAGAPAGAPASAPAGADASRSERGDSKESGDKYSVPNTCGMTLLCLVGQDTLPV